MCLSHFFILKKPLLVSQNFVLIDAGSLKLDRLAKLWENSNGFFEKKKIGYLEMSLLSTIQSYGENGPEIFFDHVKVC